MIKKQLNRRKFESRKQIGHNDFYAMVAEAFDQCGSSDSDSVYVSTRDRIGQELPYQGYMKLEAVTDTALVFHTVYPEPLRLRDVTNQVFRPTDRSRNSIQEALEDAEDYRYINFDEDVAYAMNDHGRVEEIEVPFSDIFEDFSYDDDVQFLDNGIPVIHLDEEFENVFDLGVKYLKGEVESYNDQVSSEAEDVYSSVCEELDDIIENLEEALENANESRKATMRTRRYRR